MSVVKAVITLFILVSPFIVTKVYAYLSKLYKVQGISSLSCQILFLPVYPENGFKRKWILAMVYLISLLMTISFLYEGQMNFDPSADVTTMTWLVLLVFSW